MGSAGHLVARGAPLVQGTWRATLAAILLLAVTLLPHAAHAGCPTPGSWSGTTIQTFNTCAWNDTQRADFYTRDQGSRLIPLTWLRALRKPDGTPFLQHGLLEYGYIANPASHTNPVDPAQDVSLPVGFTVSGPDQTASLGMTCSACHTREITAGGQRFRIDGGPAIADFEAFLRDIDTAAGNALQPQNFTAFAQAAIPGATAAQQAQLKDDFTAWYNDFHTITAAALPGAPGVWGLGRLDAVSMILDRVTGLDIPSDGRTPIVHNMFPADAPVRYPFLWNANVQNMTQWPGFAANGNDVFALLRNLGEVYGVFATVRPHKLWPPSFLPGPPIIDFVANNSANFDGLQQQEDHLKQIPAPAWPPSWKLDQARAARGKATFDQLCAGCHGVHPVTLQPWLWNTPIQDVGTDSRESGILGRRAADPGILKGMIDVTAITSGNLSQATIGAGSTEFSILANVVLRSIIDHTLQGQSWRPAVASVTQTPGLMGKIDAVMHNIITARGGLDNASLTKVVAQPQFADLGHAFDKARLNPTAGAPPAAAKYESRVMAGIWAAAPYLHNGSVASLAELLLPSCTDAQTAADTAHACRRQNFAVGPAYDPATAGLAADQGPQAPVRVTTDATARNSGNSRAGHEGAAFGTTLSPDARADLLEYLKTL